jgi:hypothetical protein
LMARRHAVEVRAFAHDADKHPNEKLPPVDRPRNKTGSLRIRVENVVRRQQSFENRTQKLKWNLPHGPAEDVITMN